MAKPGEFRSDRVKEAKSEFNFRGFLAGALGGRKKGTPRNSGSVYHVAGACVPQTYTHTSRPLRAKSPGLHFSSNETRREIKPLDG